LETHLILIVFLYLVFSIVALNAECKCIIKEKRIKIITMCRIMYILTLGIIPALLCCIQIAAPKAGGIIDYSENAVWTFYVQVILTVIGYLAMNFGYAIKQRTPKTHTVLGNNKVLLTSFICVCFGTVAFYLFASAFGGVDRLMEQAEWIRAGVVLPTKNIAFFKHFVPLAFLSSYLTFNLLIRKQVCGVKKLITYILFAASVVVSSLYLQANDGRLMLAFYCFLFFLFIISYNYEEKKIPIRKLLIWLILAGVILSVVLFNAETILHSFRGTEPLGDSSNEATEGDVLRKEFSFIVAGQQGAIEQCFSGEGKLMIINDLVNGLFAWLPTSLKPIRLMSVWEYNTQLITPGATGTNPTTIVAQSVYDLGILGILIIPLLFGVLVKKVERILESYPDSLFAKTVYIVLGFFLCRATTYFSLYSIMITTFFIFLGIVIYAILRRIKI